VAQAAIAESAVLSVADAARITHAIWGQSSYKSGPQSLLMRLIHHKKARHHFVTRITFYLRASHERTRIARVETHFSAAAAGHKKSLRRC
jgi:hypothetical protein